MAAKIEWQRHKDKTASIDEMLKHDVYLNNPSHDDHKGYTLMPGKNYNCRGETIQDLVTEVQHAHANHIRRKQLLKHRRRTHCKWGEAIFNLGPRTYITKEERDTIEREFIQRLFPDTAARATWHVNDASGKCDLHIIFAHVRPCGELTLKRTKTGLSKRMQSLDRYAADLLNSNPDKPPLRIPDIRTSEDVAEADAQKYSEIREEEEAAEQVEHEAKNPKKRSPKKPPTTTKKKTTAESRKMSAQVAHQAEKEGIDDVEAHHLPGLLERIGIKIIDLLKSIIKYESSRKTRKGKTTKGEVRKPRIGTIRIHDFLFDVLHAQMDLRIERDRDREMDMDNLQPETQPEAPKETQPELQPELQLELQPELQPETQAETQAETQPETQPETPIKRTKTPAEKAAMLEAYLNASLGRTKVSAKKLKALTEATKGMLKADLTIKPKLLESLSDDQKNSLVKLAKEYADEMK